MNRKPARTQHLQVKRGGILAVTNHDLRQLGITTLMTNWIFAGCGAQATVTNFSGLENPTLVHILLEPRR